MVGTANTGPRSPEEEERGFTAQAAQALEESMNAAGKKFGRTWIIYYSYVIVPIKVVKLALAKQNF